MSFHTLAWSATVAATTETDLTPVPDIQQTIQNSHFLPQQDWLMRYISVMHAVILNARIVTPSLRLITTPRIHQLTTSAAPATNPMLADYRNTPLRLKGLEEVVLDITNSAVTSGRATGVAGMDTGNYTPAPQGQVYTLRGTSSTTAVANAWTQITMTWADTLPTGMYSCIGGMHASANGQAFRLVFENQTDRAGALSQATENLQTHEMFLFGGLGEWGKFHSYRMPNVEVLANGADASHVVLIDVVKIG